MRNILKKIKILFQSYCEDIGSYLTSVETCDKENTFLNNLMTEINETGLWTGGHLENGNWSWLAGDYFTDKSIPKNHHKFLKFTNGALIPEKRKVQLPFACRKFDIKWYYYIYFGCLLAIALGKC